MLVKTVTEQTEENAEILDEAKRMLKAFQIALADLLEQAKESGELFSAGINRKERRESPFRLLFFTPDHTGKPPPAEGCRDGAVRYSELRSARPACID